MAVRKAAAKEKPYKMADRDGLYLLVKTNGAKAWRFDYRYGGKRKTIGLGVYPAVSLATARSELVEVRKTLAQGRDPSEKRQSERGANLDGAEHTFEKLADEYLQRMRDEGVANATLTKNEWLLKKLPSRGFLSRPIKSITARHILDEIKRCENSGRLETALRLRAVISKVFRLAIVTLRADMDPASFLVGATKRPRVVSHAAVTDETKFGGLIRAVDEYDGWPTLRLAMMFTALTAARPGEVRHATWTEIDCEKALWSVPAERMKMRKEHQVALSEQAIAVLKQAREIAFDTDLVFPSIRSNTTPLSENSMNAALRRMGYLKTEHTAHGFRSSFSTILNERGFDAELIETALAHKDGSVRGIYNRARYWDERKKLMQAWADIVDTLKAGSVLT
ncbi:putative prophage CPS-53 integrase [Hartmannibacter diazotrophicus]|uniref:Putative prophage CPS-53 integrase n=2 Tax=Hartmannibacter diazotrophicus TaxID=1482074 RepID=A0A2C9D1Y1_9HYPH|nr:putative prophage CPS-53 integrase [Hartmannibacter diazotrophicus]